MKLSLYGNVRKWLLASLIAPTSLFASHAATIEISQDDADAGTRYQIDSDGVVFQLTESVMFEGYAPDSFTINHRGNVFWYNAGPHFYKSRIEGDSGGTYDLKISGGTRTLTGDYGYGNAYLTGGGLAVEYHTFRNLNVIEISNNSLHSTMTSINSPWTQGGGLESGQLILHNVNQFIVKDNVISGTTNLMGGGINVSTHFRTGEQIGDTDEYVEGSGTGDIIITGNSVLVQGRGASAYGGGMINLNGSGRDNWYNTGMIVFRNNKVTYDPNATIEDVNSWKGTMWGGAYYTTNGLFTNTKNILFEGNEVNSTGDEHGVTAYGGAIFSASVMFSEVKSLTADPAIIFKNNRATGNAESVGRGGAIDTARIWIYETEGALFQDNYALTYGGAIHLRAHSGSGLASVLAAQNGDITFIGNTAELTNPLERNSGVANAIYATKGTESNPISLYLNADDAYSVNFYDPITSSSDDYNLFVIYINAASHGTKDGIVRFSGKHVKDTLAGSEGSTDYNQRLEKSKKSDINATIWLGGGTLLLEEGVTLGRKYDDADAAAGTGAYYYMGGGLLDISGSAENGMTTIAAETIEIEEGTIKAGNYSRFDANNIDFSYGLTFDLGYYLSPGAFLDHPGLLVGADQSVVFGGNITISDNEVDYYADRKWRRNATFVLFDASSIDEGIISGEFEEILSTLTGSSVVDDPYQFKGEWTLEWEGGKLLAHWNVLGGIEEIRPEMAGGMTLNTLWSTYSNLTTFNRTALGQAGAYRYFRQKDSNYWATGLGDFSSHNSKGDADGYEYNGGGYAVGADHKIGDRAVAGLAFGQLFGSHKSKSYSAKADLNSLMGMIYGGYYQPLGDRDGIDFQGSAAYANTSNKADTHYDGGTSHGKWDNDAWLVNLYGTWDHKIDENWTFSPYIGLEYVDAKQESFTESGYSARHFGEGKLRNLSLPVGAGIQHQAALSNGMVWINSLRASYIPDVYRKNPSGAAVWLENDFSWKTRGVAAARNAARLEYNTRLVLNESWNIFAGYLLEGRHRALYQKVNLGVSFSF